MRDETTAGEMIQALKRLPPETVLRCEGGWCGISLPKPEDVLTTSSGRKWVDIG